ncbi:hypothetical protein LMH87_005219 [Akanthomyces muscarius]|uniref:Signal peptide-containing protein n=1 Tax=Akanthomyces muscarius TaxID=2231603 RepID=A0A9W8URN5_AKAMU|nr:hypothetical protein LMH87_005219 [Akanthomyces muscarius]KAJ4163495.1 hypothetical protein LMH87_005219 [Akanthomyces muscarius]
MSFPVALQSAIFYIVACTPCAKIRHRQKARDLAKKERIEKAARLETEQPGLYQHPSPFNTNPYWKDEITMGPTLPKKSASKNSSQRGLTSSGRDSCTPSVSERTNVDDSRTNIDSMSILREADDDVPQDWNRKTGYQREDEELWGQWSGRKLKDAVNKARDSAGRLIESTLGLEKEVTDQERRDFYTTPRNPPVNDYHPPVVSSRPAHRDAHKWMLQPPPSAKVMEGKVPVSRAASSGSKSSGRTLVADDPFLDKIIQDKLAKEHADAAPTESELIESLFATRSNQSVTRARSLSFEGGGGGPSDDKAAEDLFAASRWKPKARPVAAPPGITMDDLSSDDESYALAPLAKPTSHVAQRPRLETIPSTDASTGTVHRELTKKRSKRSRSRRRSRASKLMATVGSPVGDDTE